MPPRRRRRSLVGVGGGGLLGPNLVSHDFEDLTDGPFHNGPLVNVDYVAAPGGLGGAVRILYDPFAGDPGSSDRQIFFNPPWKIGYGQTLWCKATVYFPSAVVSGGPQNFSNTRKMMDWFGNDPHPRFILERDGPGGNLIWVVGQVESGVYHADTITTTGNTGIALVDNQAYTIEVRLTTNSANGITDGVLEIYMDGALTPTFRRATGLQPINDLVAGGTFFNDFRLGTQLTIHYPTDPQYTQYRYWGGWAFSTQRIGAIVSDYTKYDTAVANDVFAGANGTLLQNHIADSDQYWSKIVSGWSDTGNSLALQNGRVYNTGVGGSNEWYKSTQRTPTPDITVKGDLKFLSIAEASQAGGMARIQHEAYFAAADVSFYAFYFADITNNTWNLARLFNGVFTVLASYDAGAGVYALNQVVPWELAVSGSGAAVTIKCKVDGVQRINFADVSGSRIVARGYPGLRTYGSFASPSTKGQHIGNYSTSSP